MLVLFVSKSKMLQVLRTSCWVLRVFFVVLKNFKIYFFNAVVIGAGIFHFTQARVFVFDLTASGYIYFAFTTLAAVAELCTLLRDEVIVLKCR